MRDRAARRDRDLADRAGAPRRDESSDAPLPEPRHAWLSALGNQRVQRLMTQGPVDRQATTQLARETAARPAMTPERAIEHMQILRGDLTHTIGELSVWVEEAIHERRRRSPPGVSVSVDEEGKVTITTSEWTAKTDTAEWALVEVARNADKDLWLPALLLEETPTEREIEGAADELGKVAKTLAGLGYGLKEGEWDNEELGAAFIHNAVNFGDFRDQVRAMASPDEGSKED